MRPAGEIREALRACFPAQGQGVATWHDALNALGQQRLVNPAAPGERRLVQRTVENMKRAGELVAQKPVPVLGSRRPAMGYARSGWATSWGGGSLQPGTELGRVVAGWR